MFVEEWMEKRDLFSVSFCHQQSSCEQWYEGFPQNCLQVKWTLLTFSKNASLVGVRATSWAIVLNDYDISSFLVGPKSCLYFIASILIYVSWGSSPVTKSLFFLSAACVEGYVLGQVIMGYMNELYLVFNWGQHNLLGWKSCRSHLMMFPTCTSLLGIPVTDLMLHS